MAQLTIALRKTSVAIPDPVLYLEGPDSLGIVDAADLHQKLRNFFDRIEHLKYLGSWSVFLQNDLDEGDQKRLRDYAPIVQYVTTNVRRSLGDAEDSLVGYDHILGNLDFILKRPDLSFYQLEKPFDAIVVAAGPSLEQEIDTLRGLQETKLLICCDAVLHRLLKAGITPHIVVTLERVDLTVNFFENLPEDLPTLLVAQPMAKRRTFEIYTGPISTVAKYTGIFLWFPFDRVKFWAGASSAHLAFKVAEYLGASRVALVGQDLCFHPETHQSHAQIEAFPDWGTKKDEPKPLSEHEKLMEVPGNTYEKVVTQGVWDQFAHEYSVLVKESKVATVNTSVLGRVIDGIAFQRLCDWQTEATDRKIPFFDAATNPYQSEERAALKEKWASTEEELRIMNKKLASSLSDDEVNAMYQNLFKFKPFLELVLEVVVRDYSRIEGKIFREDEQHKASHQKEFLQLVQKASGRILELLDKHRHRLDA